MQVEVAVHKRPRQDALISLSSHKRRRCLVDENARLVANESVCFSPRRQAKRPRSALSADASAAAVADLNYVEAAKLRSELNDTRRDRDERLARAAQQMEEMRAVLEQRNTELQQAAHNIQVLKSGVVTLNNKNKAMQAVLVQQQQRVRELEQANSMLGYQLQQFSTRDHDASWKSSNNMGY